MKETDPVLAIFMAMLMIGVLMYLLVRLVGV